jgi:protein downstream neighbor of Son
VSRQKSLLLIKGMTNSQLFINFLMNTRVCIANSGALSGVPPTILSHIAFHGSTLQSFKLKQTKSTQNTADYSHCLEITGPLLPNSVVGLINLFKQTQKCFNGSFISYEQTIPFSYCDVKSNKTTITSVAFARENLKDCGLEKEFLNYICSDEHQSKHIINDLLCKNSQIVAIDKSNRL